MSYADYKIDSIVCDDSGTQEVTAVFYSGHYADVEVPVYNENSETTRLENQYVRDGIIQKKVYRFNVCHSDEEIRNFLDGELSLLDGYESIPEQS